MYFFFFVFLFTAQRVKDVEAIRSQHPDKIPVSVFSVCVCVCVCDISLWSSSLKTLEF